MIDFCLQILLLLCLVFSSYEHAIPNSDPASKCHPFPSGNNDHYIVGYGSLLKTSSKRRTYQTTGPSIPVEVNGFRREWNIKGDDVGLDLSYLGVVADRNSSFNGVIFRLLPADNLGHADNVESLKSYDKREKYYCRQQVNAEDIKELVKSNEDISSTQDKYYWIYVNIEKFVSKPSKDYPIVQSYVDEFISGCIEVEETYKLPNFTKTCIDNTGGWNAQYWVNDRIFPRRPFLYEPAAPKIDKALLDFLKVDLANILIEG